MPIGIYGVTTTIFKIYITTKSHSCPSAVNSHLNFCQRQYQISACLQSSPAFLKFSHKWSHIIYTVLCLFLSIIFLRFIHTVVCIVNMLPFITAIPLYCYIIICLSVELLLYIWVVSKLGYYEQNCYRYSYTSVSVDVYFYFFGGNRSRIAGA